MKATFKMFFFAQKTKIKSNGRVPVLARITINGKMSTFSTQVDVEPDSWDTKAGRTDGTSKEGKRVNAVLDQIYTSCQHTTPPEPSAMSKGTTTKARRQLIEVPAFRLASGL